MEGSRRVTALRLLRLRRFEERRWSSRTELKREEGNESNRVESDDSEGIGIGIGIGIVNDGGKGIGIGVWLAAAAAAAAMLIVIPVPP